MRTRTVPTEEQKAAAAENRARLAELATRIKAMSEAERFVLAANVNVRMLTGHPLSLRNTLMVAMQNPGATVLGGFQQWLGAGRAVIKGEKAIGILAPKTTGKSAESETSPDQDAAPDRMFFVTVNVFDIAQTQEKQPS